MLAASEYLEYTNTYPHPEIGLELCTSTRTTYDFYLWGKRF